MSVTCSLRRRRRILTPIFFIVFGACFATSGEGADPPKEGELQVLPNLETADLKARQEILERSLDEVDRKLTELSFRQEYGDRIRMKAILVPDRDHELTPAYLFEGRGAAKEPRPGLVIVHGGFHSSFGEDSFEWVARGVVDGYAVIFPEYRGSKGFGAAHYKAQDYGGKEVDDVLAAAEYLAARPGIDPHRVGILGRSRGGMITLLAIAKAPSRFCAAVDVVGIADFVAFMSYKAEWRRKEVAALPHFKALPDANLPPYIDASPIQHVDKIETPLLILATTHDTLVPIELHTNRLIDALKARGKTFEAKIYDHAPGGHNFTLGETPEARDAEKRIFEFLKARLKP